MSELRVIDPEFQRCWIDERPCHEHCKAFDTDSEDCRILRVGEDVVDVMTDFVMTISKLTKPNRPKRKQPRKRDGMDKSK
jgi:hypothetical protein